MGSGPCGIAATDDALWVGVLGQNELVRLDPSTGTVTDRLDVGGQVWDVQFGHGSIWATVRGPNDLVRVDPDSAEITAHYPTASIPSGIAITDNEVWVADSLGSVTRIDPETEEPLAALELEGDPSWFAVGPNSVVLASSNAGTAAVLDKQHGRNPGLGGPGRHPARPRVLSAATSGSRSSPRTRWRSSARTPGNSSAHSRSPTCSAIWTAEGLIGDGWVLDYGGTTVVDWSRIPAFEPSDESAQDAAGLTRGNRGT